MKDKKWYPEQKRLYPTEKELREMRELKKKYGLTDNYIQKPRKS